jgi:amino acid permease
VIPVAIRTTIARLIIFFIGTVFVLAALIPMQQAGVEKARSCWCLKRSAFLMPPTFLTL